MCYSRSLLDLKNRILILNKAMIQKHFLSFLFIGVLSLCAWAQDFSDIVLPAPVKTGGKPLMEALNDRQTIREFSEKELSVQDLSNLLWASFGVNRAESGKRTAPSAMNRQEIEIYVSLKSGIYLYDATKNVLKAIKQGDYRKDMGKQPFVATAPLVLVLVADYALMSERATPERKDFYAAIDAGYISQNIYLFAASENMATVALGSFDKDLITGIIPFKDTQKIVITQAVGFLR